MHSEIPQLHGRPSSTTTTLLKRMGSICSQGSDIGTESYMLPLLTYNDHLATSRNTKKNISHATMMHACANMHSWWTRSFMIGICTIKATLWLMSCSTNENHHTGHHCYLHPYHHAQNHHNQAEPLIITIIRTRTRTKTTTTTNDHHSNHPIMIIMYQAEEDYSPNSIPCQDSPRNVAAKRIVRTPGGAQKWRWSESLTLRSMDITIFTCRDQYGWITSKIWRCFIKKT